jgi:hypothetical protein
VTSDGAHVRISLLFLALLAAQCVVRAQPASDPQRRIVPVAEGQKLRRVALVIGNGSYGPVLSLKNPPNDARSVAAALRELDFDVKELINGSREDMDTAVDQFVGKLGPGTVGLFYYSGHGLEIDGVNYLVSTDFKGGDPVKAKYRSVSANEVQALMEERRSQLNILILDACRDSPASSGTRGISGGPAPMEGKLPGTVIVFATAPKKTASDNSKEENGLFTKHLLAGLKKPNLDISGLFNYVGHAVWEESGEKQMPYINSTPLDPFYLRESGTAMHPTAKIEDLLSDRAEVSRGTPVFLTARTSNPAGLRLRYDWTATGGSIEGSGEHATVRADEAVPGRVEGAVRVTLVVTDGAGGADRRTLDLPIRDRAASVIFSADRDRVMPGESVRLRWNAPGSLSARLDPGGAVPPTGEKTVSPTRTAEYTLTVMSGAGPVTKRVTILVSPRVDAFEGVPKSLHACQDLVLRWTVEGASTVRIEPGLGSVNPASGYRVLRPLRDTVYVLTADGAGGQTVQRLPVAVTPAAGPCGRK